MNNTLFLFVVTVWHTKILKLKTVRSLCFENVPIKKNVTGMLKYLTVTLFTVKIDTNAKVL